MSKIYKFKFPLKNDIRNFYLILRSAYSYGGTYKLLWCDNRGYKWLQKNGLNKCEILNVTKNIYRTPFGEFSLIRSSSDKEFLMFTEKEGNLGNIFHLDIKTSEYIWLVGGERLFIKNFQLCRK